MAQRLCEKLNNKFIPTEIPASLSDESSHVWKFLKKSFMSANPSKPVELHGLFCYDKGKITYSFDYCCSIKTEETVNFTLQSILDTVPLAQAEGLKVVVDNFKHDFITIMFTFSPTNF